MKCYVHFEKFGTLHEFACHPCAGGHANILCIVPTLIYIYVYMYIYIYVLPEQA